MPTPSETHIIVGKIGAPYGVRGWVKIQSFTEPPENILNYHPWYLASRENQWQAFDTEDRKIHGNSVMVKLAGINSPEEARLHTGQLIAIAKEQLPALQKNEFYWADLYGLTVINKDGVKLGTVTNLMETGANDVLIVKGDKEFAVPYLFGKVILKVDLEKREIHVDWEPV